MEGIERVINVIFNIIIVMTVVVHGILKYWVYCIHVAYWGRVTLLLPRAYTFFCFIC